MSIRIRKARPEEANDLTKLSMRSKQSNGYDDEFMEACRDELTVTEDHFLTREFWVAEAEGVCGVVGLCLDEDGLSGEVCSLFIDPDWKRKGIGQLLWQTLVEHATANGLKSLRLDADPAAVPFYKALGFQTVGQVPSDSIVGRTLPHMLLNLE